jgi:hypothetical protein
MQTFRSKKANCEIQELARLFDAFDITFYVIEKRAVEAS